MGQINQNTAPGGWSTIPDSVSVSVNKVDVTQFGDYPGTQTGADMVDLNTPSLTALGEIKDLTYHTASEIASIQRHFINEKGQPEYVLRQDPAMAGQAYEVTLPQNYAFWLKNPDNRVVGHEKLFNRDVTVIEGKHDEYLAKKLGAVQYKMWVDTETGVLLKLVGTDAQGQEAYHIKVQNIRFNQQVDHARFAPVEPKGWVKMERR